MLRVRHALIGSAVICALASGTMASFASAMTQEQIPSVSVHPVGTTKADPNEGKWFVTDLEPERSKKLQVRLYNPAPVAQTVKLYLADIRFDSRGIPEVRNVSTDIGTWGRFDDPTVTIAPLDTQIQAFSVTAPKGADPGDHVGAVVAEHAPQGSGNVRSIKRVAVRFYATLPGDASRDFVIDKVTTKKDSGFFASELTVTVRLRNTGRVRLEPTVQVDGVVAEGPELLMSNAVERYIVTVPVKFWGGPMRLRIDATTRSLGLAGPVRQLRVTAWVIPWHLFVLIAVLGGLVLLVRLAIRRRTDSHRRIQSELRRLERLLSQQNRAAPSPRLAGQEADAFSAIRAAIKQARRTGDLETAEILEHKSDEIAARRRARAFSNGGGSG